MFPFILSIEHQQRSRAWLRLAVVLINRRDECVLAAACRTDTRMQD